MHHIVAMVIFHRKGKSGFKKTQTLKENDEILKPVIFLKCEEKETDTIFPKDFSHLRISSTQNVQLRIFFLHLVNYESAD